MKEVLIRKLLQYIRENNPDVLMRLEKKQTLNEYLSGKIQSVNNLINSPGKMQPDYIIEATCMDILTKDLCPSKFNFIKKILWEEFNDIHQRFADSGLLLSECINLVNHCQSLFEDLRFSEETESNLFLRYTIINAINEYLEFHSQEILSHFANENPVRRELM